MYLFFYLVLVLFIISMLGVRYATLDFKYSARPPVVIICIFWFLIIGILGIVNFIINLSITAIFIITFFICYAIIIGLISFIINCYNDI